MKVVSRFSVLVAIFLMFLVSFDVVSAEINPASIEKIWSYTKEDSEATLWKLDWSPDGKFVAATFFDNKCVILNSGTGEVVKILDMNSYITRCDGFAPQGTLPLRCCVFSPDGRFLATGGDDLKVRLFETGTWELKRTFLGHSGSVLCLDFSPDSRYLASGSGTDKVIPQNEGENITRVWNIETGKQETVLDGHRDGVLAVKWSDAGDMLATASDDRTLKVWSFPEGDVIHSMKGHTSGLLDVDWSNDGHLLYTGSRDYKIKVWDWKNESELMSWSDYNCVRSVEVHPESQIIATSGVDLTLKIRDIDSGSELKVVKDGVEQKAMVMSSRWSPDGERLASGLGKSHTVIMYDFGGSSSSGGGPDNTMVTVTVLLILGLVGLGAIMYPAYREIRRRRD
jgi:WD40 repeat protein